MKRLDLTGQSFGLLTVLAFAGIHYRRKLTTWTALCSCGEAVTVLGANLTNGNTKSCGCQKKAACDQTTHGLSGTPTYVTWTGMIDRCTNPNTPAFRRYGERGIAVCDRWLSFENFYADMGKRPEGMSLERVNNDLGYSPTNCKWATRKEQANNRSTNRQVAAGGATKTLSQWAEASGLRSSTILRRLSKGWDPEDAVTLPTRSRNPKNKEI